MLRTPIVRLVDFCARFPWPVIVCALALSALCGDYAARHFAIKTDINNLFPPTLPWTQRASAYMKAFPQRDILAVVDAPLKVTTVAGAGAPELRLVLIDEPYWASLTQLIDWAEHNTHSSVWSCLAAHAAVLRIDGIRRRRLGLPS